MEYKYFKLDDNVKTPNYFFLGGRGNGRTFYQTMNEAKTKLIGARLSDKYFTPSNYVWLIGEYENVPSNVDTLYGIRVVFVHSTGIRLYKEV